jgi:predicted transposase YbfD/YdcC
MLLIDQFKQIPDPRHAKGRKHPLWLILMLSLLGTLCGYRGYRPLADFCVQHAEELRQLLELPQSQSFPSYSTFRRTFVCIAPHGWVEGFNQWATASLPQAVAAFFSVDGKSIRATSTGGNSSAQDFTSLVSIYSQTLGVVGLALMQNHNESEIHVAQSEITQLSGAPQGSCFSLDALHTTQTTVAVICDQQQDYFLAVKRNRQETYEAIAQLVGQTAPTSTATQVDDSHGRAVTRSAQVFSPTPELQARWRNLTTVGMVQRQGWRDNQAFNETVYYITSCAWSATQLLAASRQHWQIENGLHWVKDVTFQEDYPPQRGGFAPIHWAILNSFCITLARRQGWRTVPQAMRAWANQLHQVFHFLV